MQQNSAITYSITSDIDYYYENKIRKKIENTCFAITKKTAVVNVTRREKNKLTLSFFNFSLKTTKSLLNMYIHFLEDVLIPYRQGK